MLDRRVARRIRHGHITTPGPRLAVGARLLTIGRALVACGVGIVAVGSGLIRVRPILVGVGRVLVGARRGQLGTDRPMCGECRHTIRDVRLDLVVVAHHDPPAAQDSQIEATIARLPECERVATRSA